MRKETRGEKQEVPRKVDQQKGLQLQNHNSCLKDDKRQSFWSQMSVTAARNTGSGSPMPMSQHGISFMQFL